MSLLAPLYFLGALAVGLPLLFHLIRRQPRSRLAFSSLMFLRSSPPRLTRRSRLDNLPLLLMRGLALILIAAAFARPFFRNPVQTAAPRDGRQVLLLVDTSASMRRDGLWPRAIASAGQVLDQLQPQDRVGLMVFDSQPQTLVALDGHSASEADLGATAVRQAITEIRPTWRASDLGLALTTAADMLHALANSDAAVAQQTELVLISDLQAGAGTDALQGYPWPPDVRLAIRAVAPDRTTNASVLVMAETPAVGQELSGGAPAVMRVRVANAADSRLGQFQLQWADAAGQPLARNAARAVNVPPGEVRVVRMQPPEGVASIVLTGDDHDFDNTVYLAMPQPVRRTLLFVGDDPSDPRDSLLYYLRQTSLNTPQQTVIIQRTAADQPLPPLDPQQNALVVVAAPLANAAARELRQFVEAGGKVWCVLSQPVAQQTADQGMLRVLSGDSQLTVEEASVEDYALLGSVDFADPLFAIFADPRFSDFSKIRFWAHRRIHLPEEAGWDIAARFDDGSPAMLRRTIGAGSLFVLAAGWQPTGSQLALSTKFVPLIARLIDPAAGEGAPQASYAVGDTFDLPAAATLTLPDGTERPLGGESPSQAIDRPGIYRLTVDGTSSQLAVNVPAAESRTEPLEPAQLEQLGVPLAERPTAEQAEALQRQMRDIELEQRQQWWRWLVVVAIALLAVETWWAGWLGNRSTPTLDLTADRPTDQPSYEAS